MKSLELRWGLMIGFAGLIWLYLSFFLGFHTGGIAKIQTMFLISLLVSFIAYFFAFLSLTKHSPEITYSEGVKSGLIMTALSALVAVLAQVGYFFWINPEWTEYMVGETRNHFETLGLKGEALEEKVTQAKTTFSFKSYVFQSALGALVIGTIFSAIIMGAMVLRRRR